MGRYLHDVVVGLDGSTESTTALQWALDQVLPDGHVHAVHVLVPAEELALDAALGDSVALRHHREHEMTDVWVPKARTGGTADDVDGVEVRTVVREGPVADELLAVADEVDADVIAVGHHAAARFGPRLVGHVVARLLRTTTRPLAIVPATWTTDATADLPVAVGVGVSRGTRAAIDWVLAHQRIADGGLRLVHAIGQRSFFRSDGWLDVLAYHLDPHLPPAWVADDLLELADDLRSRTTADIDVEVAVRPGRTGARLVEAAERSRLLVVGRGEPPFIRNHAIAPYLRHAIRHASCPILVVPADDGR